MNISWSYFFGTGIKDCVLHLRDNFTLVEFFQLMAVLDGFYFQDISTFVSFLFDSQNLSKVFEIIAIPPIPAPEDLRHFPAQFRMVLVLDLLLKLSNLRLGDLDAQPELLFSENCKN